MLVLFVFSALAGFFTMLSCILPILPIVLAARASKGRWKPLGVSDLLHFLIKEPCISPGDCTEAKDYPDQQIS